MATISNKNPIILSSHFVVDFKKFESYMKHCINILKTQNWLREHQYDNSISDYEYLKEYINKNGIDPIALARINAKFQESIVSTIPEEKIKKIKTNKYYVDGFAQVLSMFQELKQLGGESNLPSVVGKEDFCGKFTRLFHRVISEIDLDENKEFTEEEIIKLIIEGKLLILQSGVEKVNLSIPELKRGINLGTIDFVNRSFEGGWIFERDMGDTFDFLEARSEDERKVWFAKNMLMLRYLRQKEMTFDKPDTNEQSDNRLLHCYNSFDATSEHIDIILREVAKTFSRKKKDMPEKYKTFIEYIKERQLAETKIFNTPIVAQEPTMFDMDN